MQLLTFYPISADVKSRRSSDRRLVPYPAGIALPLKVARQHQMLFIGFFFRFFRQHDRDRQNSKEILEKAVSIRAL